MAGNLANLQKATAARTAGALARAETALNAMLKDGEPITFRGLAARAAVSLDFLYHSTPIRARVEHLRDRQRTEAAPAFSQNPAPASPATSSAPSPPSSPRPGAVTARRPPPCARRWRPPTARTCSCAAASAATPPPATRHEPSTPH